MENRIPKYNQFIIGSKSDAGCKKHPRHKQSPGVCSVCLGEKLSKLSASPSSKTSTKNKEVSSCSSSDMSSCSSRYSSFEASPAHHKHRMASMKNVTVNSLLRSKGEDVFRKSRSMAAIEREIEKKKNGKKKNGFWSKLLRPKRKKIEDLVQSSLVTTRVH